MDNKIEYTLMALLIALGVVFVLTLIYPYCPTVFHAVATVLSGAM